MSAVSCRRSPGMCFGVRWICVYLTAISLRSASSEPLKVSAPHMSYICPEGASVTMECLSEGTLLNPGDHLRHNWLFTPHQSEPCRDRVHPRGGNRSVLMPPGVQYGSKGSTFWVTLVNVTYGDQGRYCCLDLDLQGSGHHHMKVVQRPHSHILLTITPRQNVTGRCSVFGQKPTEGTVAAGLATAGCIMGILSLPLILLLVYKQRQSVQSSRRAHELVRMDSGAQGQENPVFLGDGPQPKTRTVSQILARQSSETGRHLLLDPGTPLSPSSHGDVFFPAHDPIPESPDFMQV